MRVEGHVVEGTRPPQWALRCLADGLKEPVKLQWRFPAGVKQIGGGAPQDEAIELVQPPERNISWAECAATGADGVTVRASHALEPIAIGAAPTTARVGELITVRGGGFGPTANPDDAVWLVPPWGHALAADATCKGAVWGDAAVSVCVPKEARGRTWLVRVQSSETLATAPKPLVVAP